MSPVTTPDPLWVVADLVERSRRLAVVASGTLRAERVRGDVRAQAEELQQRCASACAIADRFGRRRRPPVATALDRLAVAVDDVAAVALMRATDAGAGRTPISVDLLGLLERVGERHDAAAGLLRRRGVRRTTTAP